MKQLNNTGFTMIELIIVLPIVSITTLAMINYTTSQYAKLHTETSKANLRLEAETMLLDLEDELLFSTDFSNTKSTDLADANQPVGGWTNATTPNTLIVYETSLTAPRRDPDREFVYKNTYGCTGGYSAYNPIALNNLIYFSAANTDDPYYTLYRRTLTPQYSVCNTNYKVQTCPEGLVGQNGCGRVDSKLTEKLQAMTVEYFAADNAVTTVPTEAEKIKLTITLGEKLFGESISVTSSITMKKIN